MNEAHATQGHASTPITKILFLDIDGVLNNEKSYILERVTGSEFDLYSILLVNLLCRFSGARIVFHSSRAPATPGGLKLNREDLESAGLDWTLVHQDWSARIPTGSKYRGQMIDAWLSKHPEVTHYAILDDESVYRKGRPHPGLVSTHFNEGLQGKHIYKIIKMLGEDIGAFVRFCHDQPRTAFGTPAP